jgi:hypothetical protein
MEDFARRASDQAVVSDDLWHPRNYSNHRESRIRSDHFHRSFYAIFGEGRRERHNRIELERNAGRLISNAAQLIERIQRRRALQ